MPLTQSGSENEKEFQSPPARSRGTVTARIPEPEADIPTAGAPDAGLALDTARTQDRLAWEETCENVQRRINNAYALELWGKRARQIGWLVSRWSLVIVLGSCFIAWTGWVAMVLFYAALVVLALGVAGMLLGGGIELLSQLRQCWLLHRGAKDHLELYDPSLRPVR